MITLGYFIIGFLANDSAPLMLCILTQRLKVKTSALGPVYLIIIDGNSYLEGE